MVTQLDGEYLINATLTDVTPNLPGRGLRVRAFPNPFNPSVRISFMNPARGDVSATIYDPLGRRVAVLVSRAMEAGEQHLEWDGRDAARREAPSGVYFLRVSAAGTSESIKLVLLR